MKTKSKPKTFNMILTDEERQMLENQAWAARMSMRDYICHLLKENEKKNR